MMIIVWTLLIVLYLCGAAVVFGFFGPLDVALAVFWPAAIPIFLGVRWVGGLLKPLVQYGERLAEREPMMVHAGQIWKDDSTGVEIEIIESPASATWLREQFGEKGEPLTNVVRISSKGNEGVISYKDLYEYYCLVRP